MEVASDAEVCVCVPLRLSHRCFVLFLSLVIVVIVLNIRQPPGPLFFHFGVVGPTANEREGKKKNKKRGKHGVCEAQSLMEKKKGCMAT